MKLSVPRPSSALGVSLVAIGLASLSAVAWAKPLPPRPAPPADQPTDAGAAPPAPSAPPPSTTSGVLTIPPAPPPSTGGPRQAPPPPGADQPQPLYAPPPDYGYEPPIPPRYVKVKEPDDPSKTRAPDLSLSIGARLGWDLPLGGAFRDASNNSRAESSFIKPGPLLQLDFGVRVARKFVPFLFYAHTFGGDGTASTSPGATFRVGLPVEDPRGSVASVTSAKSDLVGLGVRYLFSPDDWGAALEISYAYRFTRATFSDGAAYKADAPGLLRLAAGVDIRTGRLFSLSPMIVATVGSYSDVVVQRPGGTERNVLSESMTSGYIGAVLGGSFDLFSKWE